MTTATFATPSTADQPAAPQSEPLQPVTVISPPGAWPRLDLHELWRYRDLLLMLLWRGISANYRQSVIGIGWAILKPLITVMIFSFIFGRVAQLGPKGVPYPVYVLSGLIPWMYFANALGGSTNSLISGTNLLTKVYFPRLILPLTATLSGLVDMAIQFSLMAVMMAWYGVVPGPQLVLLPVFIATCTLSALALGLHLTTLNVKYRDVTHAVPFLIQCWMWMTPIVYTMEIFPERIRPILSLNPMVSAVEGFRWCLLGAAPPDPVIMAISLSAAGFLFVTGLYHFRRMEATFADLI